MDVKENMAAGKAIGYGSEVHELSPADVEHHQWGSPAGSRPADSQSLERFINHSSVVNFGLIILCSWEVFAVTFQFALANGGPASMVYGSILAGFGGSAVATSLAELASMDCTVGAQYRWSASLAPFAPRFWGLIQGWATIFAWTAGCASSPAIISQMIRALAIFNYESYVPKAWHNTLLMWALIIVPFIFNLWCRQLLGSFEMIGGLFHFIFFVISVITLVVLAKRSTTDFVFNTLTSDQSGWENPGVSFGIGLLTVSYAISAFDGVLHMSDEIKNVRTRAPRSIIIAAVTNSVLLFAFVICLLFTIGDIDVVTNSPTGLPIIEVYYQATGSKAFTTVLVAMPAVIFFFAMFNTYASVSRLIWAFAKDHGLPFSRVFSYVHPTLRLPFNALALISIVAFLLAIIYIASDTAFNAIISLQALSLSVSYIPPIAFMALRRIRGTAPEPGPFSMGRFGLAINLFSLAYLAYVVTWMPFPQFLPVTAKNMNYAGPLLGAVLIGALADWFLNGRKRFQIPLMPTRSD